MISRIDLTDRETYVAIVEALEGIGYKVRSEVRLPERGITILYRERDGRGVEIGWEGP